MNRCPYQEEMGRLGKICSDHENGGVLAHPLWGKIKERCRAAILLRGGPPTALPAQTLPLRPKVPPEWSTSLPPRDWLIGRIGYRLEGRRRGEGYSRGPLGGVLQEPRPGKIALQSGISVPQKWYLLPLLDRRGQKGLSGLLPKRRNIPPGKLCLYGTEPPKTPANPLTKS